VHASADPAAIGACDAVLFCVKSYDTDRAAALLPALCHERTVVASLQNGVDNAERIGRVVGPARVVGGVALIAALVTDPGVVTPARAGASRIRRPRHHDARPRA
jgi:2-dehydropantoate 2-reductase